MIRKSLFLLPLLLSACLTPTGTQQPVEVVNYGVKGGAGSAGMHTVLNGDTVYTVSQRYNLPLREIISLNSLEAPYHLRSGFRLKLPPPNDYKVRPGDTLNGISRVFGVSVSETAKLNNLVQPYTIEKGQVLRLPTPQPAVVEQGFASAAPSPTFENAAMRVPSVESEALTPPPGSIETASVTPAVIQSPPPVESSSSASAAAGFPPQPTAKPATVQPAAATTLPSNIAPKVPARTGRFMRPVDGKVISGYGPKDGGLHNDGINIKAPKGTAVRAAENGVVAYTGSEMAGYGNLVLIRHQDRWITAYAHMEKILVKKGDVVKAGQSIGTVGATGSVDSPQLHFEVRKGTKAEDPAKYI